jgi:cytoskeletal protein CcmA (bactofilin family)
MTYEHKMQRNDLIPAHHNLALTNFDQNRRLTIARDINLSGEIQSCDHLIVEGTVDIGLKGAKRLDVSSTGFFNGTAMVDTAVIAGHFQGVLAVSGKLILRATAHISGVVTYGMLEVDSGAVIEGSMEHKASPPTQASSSAKVMTTEKREGQKSFSVLEGGQTKRKIKPEADQNIPARFKQAGGE